MSYTPVWFTLTAWSIRAVRSNLADSRTEPTVRTLVIALIVAAVVAVGGGQFLEARTASRVAGRLAPSVVAAESVDVELSGFPVVFRAVTGRVPEAEIEIERLTTREPEVTFAPVVLDLRDLRFDPFDLALGGAGAITVGDGSAAAVLQAHELTRLARRQGPGWEIRAQQGQLIASGDVEGSAVRVVADVSVADGALRLTAREVAVDGGTGAAAVARAFDRSIPLPELPGRIRLTAAEATPAGVVLRATIRGTLDLGT